VTVLISALLGTAALLVGLWLLILGGWWLVLRLIDPAAGAQSTGGASGANPAPP
jgi:hypothetical protein